MTFKPKMEAGLFFICSISESGSQATVNKEEKVGCDMDPGRTSGKGPTEPR